MNIKDLDHDTVIVGAGQAGLATAWHLKQLGLPSLVLDARPHVGDVWRARWDSLLLFTPARHSALPGSPHDDPAAFLGKDAFADYLQRYSTRNGLQVRTGVPVTSVVRDGDAWLVTTPDGALRTANVVVATGANAMPRLPAVASGLDAGVRQLHSLDYRNPAQVPEGDVLVVGAGTSGIEIALDLAGTHRVSIAGRPTPHVPAPLLTYAGDVWWAFISNVLTRGTPIGRKAAAGFHHRGSPLLRVSPQDLDRAGVERLPRLENAADGVLTFSSGAPDATPLTRAAPSTIIWCTGYRSELGWFPDLPRDEYGYPANERGIVGELPGAYTVGMPFQWGLTSELIGGVGRDAAHVAQAIANTPRSATPQAANPPGYQRPRSHS
jgi:putative flavoprotein involved in K+ transport